MPSRGCDTSLVACCGHARPGRSRNRVRAFSTCSDVVPPNPRHDPSAGARGSGRRWRSGPSRRPAPGPEEKRGLVLAESSARYLPKYARQSRRDCRDESRGVSSAVTTSSARFRWSTGSEGGSFQDRRARMFSWMRVFDRVSSSVRRWRSRTWSSNVSNCSSSIVGP